VVREERLVPISVPTLLLALFLALVPRLAGAQDRVVKLGVIGPLTGDFAFGGQYQLAGAQLRAEELNAQGGGIRIEIVSEDDASKCDQSVAAARKLLSRDQIHALLGAWQSTCTLAIVPLTAQAEVPQYTTSVAGPITQQGSRWIFRVGIPTSGLNRATLEHAVKRQGFKKIAIFTSNEEVGKSVAATSVAVLQSLGLTPVAREEWNRGDKDFTGQLGRIRASGAEAMIFSTGFAEQSIIARQVRQLGMKLQLLGGDTIGGNPKFLELAGPDIEGLVFSVGFIAVEDDPRVGAFVKRYRERHRQVPDSWAALFYDTVGLVHAAVKATGSVDRKAIAEYTRGLRKGAAYPGVVADMHFDDKGDPQWDPLLVQIVGGKWKILR
jgi:branched-chain amino acid transport system substrate-binding protein